MSLDVTLSEEVFSANITHNLGTMASEVQLGEYTLYQYLWRPEEIFIRNAEELIKPLSEGLQILKSDPVKYTALQSDNGWGLYENFIPWIEKYLHACIMNPSATILTDR